MPEPTTALIDEISAIASPAERNRRITRCYHELAIALRDRVGVGANWCAFATWASRQAGFTIRREDARQLLTDLLGDSRDVSSVVATVSSAVLGPARRAELTRLVDEVREALDLDGALERSSDAVARGNLKVFAEIAREFSRFLPVIASTPSRDEERLEAFCGGLRDGDPPEGQRHLRRAFRLYAAAAASEDEAAQARALFHANVLVGLHEQTRLQPEIAEAMESALGRRDELRVRLRAVFVRGPFWSLVNAIARTVFGREPIDPLLDRVIHVAAVVVRRALTATMMTLHMPGNATLRLAHDLDGSYQPALVEITDPELTALLASVDPDPSGPRASGTVDWGDFPDRMHFIVELFRTRHADVALFAFEDSPGAP